MLYHRGKSLNKEELTSGKKTDQRLHEIIAKEYNDTKKVQHDMNAFPGHVSTTGIPLSG